MSSKEVSISLGEVQDLVVVKSSFEKDQSVTMNFGAQMKTGPAEVTINFGVPWHADLREAVKALDLHCARLSGQLGHLSQIDRDDWPIEAVNWWEEVNIRLRILSITWAGQNRSKVKLMGEVYLPDGYTLMQCPIIDLERSKYEFLHEFESAVARVKDELVLYIGGKSAIGRQTTIFDSDAVVEPVNNGEGAEDDQPANSTPRFALPESKVPTSPELFRKAIELALAQQEPSKAKRAAIKKGQLSSISEHMRLFCIANGAFLPDAVFNMESFANDIARGILEALKEVKPDDKALPYVVELRATTEPGDTLKWRELYPVMQPEVTGRIENTDLAMACVAFARLMIRKRIAPMQQWHSPILFGEHLAAEFDRTINAPIPELIHDTVEIYSQFIDAQKE
jgi:hypothetical protein